MREGIGLGNLNMTLVRKNSQIGTIELGSRVWGLGNGNEGM